jgi:PIF1-like helicase
VYTIEFQKRGLPHMHMLLALSPSHRLETAQQVDSVIRASWPDPEREPRLFEIVRRCMVHGPCGHRKPDAPCMKNGKCSKGFPKSFQAETVLSRDGYPRYARPNDGRAYVVRGSKLDNRWIVPYNPYFLSRYLRFLWVLSFTVHLPSFSYNAHINIECVMSLAAAKYITKYTHKGPDRATLELQQRNEVSDFIDCRYIAASEAAWRLFEIPIHHQQPAVISLQVHLPGRHQVIFNPNEPIELVTARAQHERTMLTAFFDLNHHDPFAHQYTYPELPLHFVWESGTKKWKRRQRGGSIGRMYFVSPTAGERFYLRTLLTTVRGPTGWESLRSFDDVVHPSFHAACLARGLLQNDDEWRQCLQEASLTHLGQSLRHLFTLILIHCTPSDPGLLWNQFRDHLCDDLARRLQRMRRSEGPIPIEHIYDFGLFLIDKDLAQHGSSLTSFPSMPVAEQNWEGEQENLYIVEQLAYHRDNENALAVDALQRLNGDQRAAFDDILASTTADEGKCFFLHGPGGTGKTFLYNTICHRVRANGWIVLCVASSGIAALLLPGGHTAHSTFAIPVEGLTDDSCCQIDKNSPRAEMLRHVRLIIWDEAVTQHR